MDCRGSGLGVYCSSSFLIKDGMVTMELHEELGDVVRVWRALTKREIHDWELKAIDLKTDKADLQKRNRNLEFWVGVYRMLRNAHKSHRRTLLDRNRKLEAIAKSTVRYGSFSKHYGCMLCGRYWKPENTPSHRTDCPIAELENA